MSKTTDRKTKTVTRIECRDWRDLPVAITNKGHAKPLNRKVLTKGTTEIKITDRLYTRLCRELTAGKEVRLVWGDVPFVRFYPVVGNDLKTMKTMAQTMNPFRGNVYNGMNEFRFVTGRGRRVLAKETVECRMAAKCDERSAKRKTDGGNRYVTPDMMVTCPECGTEFRVGRPAAA